MLLSSGFLSACGLVPNSVEPRGAFEGVRENVSTRTGQELLWVRTEDTAAEVATAVSTLLQKPLTAESVAQIALLNNRNLQAEFERVGIAYADYVQAGILSNPQFTVSLRWPDRPPSGVNSEYSVATNFIELLILPFRKEVASRELELAKLEVSARVLELVTSSQSAFYQLQARQELLRTLKRIVETKELAADLAKKMHEAGNLTDLDLSSQQVEYTQSRVDVAQMEALILSGRERLNRLMGLWGVDVNWNINGDLPAVPTEEPQLVNLETTALEHRLDVAAARARVEVIALSLGLKANTRLLSPEGSLGVDTERDSDGQSVTGPNLSIGLPIFDQGQAVIARFEALYRQAQRRYEAIAIDARSEVREARNLVVAKGELAHYYPKILLPQRRQVVNQTQLQQNVMQRSPFEILVAKEVQLESERAAIEARRDYWIARAEMQQALLGSTPRGFAVEEYMNEDNAAKTETRP